MEKSNDLYQNELVMEFYIIVHNYHWQRQLEVLGWL